MLDDSTLDRLTKLLGLLGSDQVGERAAAAVKAHELLHAHGTDWGELVELVRAGLFARRMPPQAAAVGVPPGQSDTEWNPSPEKDGRPGFWCRLNGMTLGVRQCRSSPRYPPAWTANVMGTLVQEGGRTVFFATAEEAMLAAKVEALLMPD